MIAIILLSAAAAAVASPDLGKIPLGLPSPIPAPKDNPITQEKVELGHQLFFDPRLSKDGRISCATCHDPKKAWGDGRTVARGLHGAVGDRNTPVVFNRAYGQRFFWDGRVESLEGQVPFPLTHATEMGADVDQVVAKLNSIPGYIDGFLKAFGRPADPRAIYEAIASFERTILSGDSPYDRFAAGDLKALSPSEKRGHDLFFKKFRCDTCHSGPLFSNEEVSPRCYPQFAIHDPKAASLEKEKQEFKGRFKTPTLRNVALSGPYFHDGALKTLEQVLDFYNHSGPLPPHFVDRKDFPAVHMNSQERTDLVAFLKALTGRPSPISAPKLPQ